MKELIFPIFIITICVVGLILMKLQLQKVNTNEGKGKASDKPVQEFVNVKDIQDIFLYTRDGFLMSYIKTYPISTDLLSSSERKILTKKLTEEFSDMDFSCFKFLAISRPVDITPLVTEYTDLINSSDNQIQKEILRQETRVISDFSLSGEVVQREFYYVLWEKDDEGAEVELKKRTYEFMQKLEDAGMKCEISKRHDIIRLCNLVNNPAYAAIEDTNVDFEIALLRQ